MTRGPDNSAWPRRRWNERDIETVRRLFPRMATKALARHVDRSEHSVNGLAHKLGLRKDDDFLAAQWRASGDAAAQRPTSIAARFKPGSVPPNKGLRMPGWAPGRMAQTQFKKGAHPFNHDPHFYVLGALRVSSDGYIDMRVSFEPGARGWRPLHRILWEDAHGAMPAGHCLKFIDGDKLNVCLENLQLISRADNMRRNSVHLLPPQLVQTVQLLGALKRTLNRRKRDGEAHR